MAWELLAIWAIVITTVVWFIRDEKRLGAEADMALAAAYYAHAPKYRYLDPRPAALPGPAKPVGGLSEQQRAFLQSYQR